MSRDWSWAQPGGGEGAAGAGAAGESERGRELAPVPAPEPGNRRAVTHGGYGGVAAQRLRERERQLFAALAQDAPLRGRRRRVAAQRRGAGCGARDGA